MKHLPALILLLLPAATLISQTVTIPGYATLQNSGGRSAFPLELSVSDGAKITKTNPATGYFEITCPASGEYFLDARKAGYEVVNPRAAHLYFFENKPNADTLRLVLNREGAWLDLADRYYRAGMTSITRTHEARLAELKNSSANPDLSDPDYRKALDSLAMRAFRVSISATDVAERLAQTDNDRCPAAYRAALRLFVEGDAAAALDALKSATTASERMLRARLFVLTLEEHNARADYEAACAANPDDYQLTREYANYLYEFPDLVDFGQAVWEKKIATARHANDRAIAWQAIGGALRRKNKLPEALEYLHKAAEIREPLAAANSFFAADYAFTCQAIARITGLTGDNSGALKWFKNAATAWSKSPNASAFSYCETSAGAKMMLAYAPGNTPADIEKILLDAADHFDRLAEHYTARGYLGKTEMLSRIANLRQNNGDRAGASSAWREMASIFEEYEEEWPLLIEGFRCNFWLTMALSTSSTPPSADEWLLSKGIERLRAAARIAPGTFDIPLAQCLNQRGADQLSARNEAGIQSLEEARLLAERYREIRAAEAVPVLAKTFTYYGYYFSYYTKDYQKAIEYFGQIIAVYQGCKSCQKDQKNWDLILANHETGLAWMNLEQPQQAIASYIEAAKVQRYVLGVYPNTKAASLMLQILVNLAFAQVSVAITNGDLTYKDAALKTVTEAEAVLAKFPNESALANFRNTFQEFKNSLKD